MAILHSYEGTGPNSIGEQGLELAGLQWLLDHHKAKEQERHQVVQDLNLQSGDVVLDLGCGPGLWTPLLAEKVKPHGRVIGIDFSPELLAFAQNRLEHEPLRDLISYRKADFSALPLDDNTVDLVFFGNCFAYVTDHKKVLDEQKRVTKPGGRIAVKDFDGVNMIFHPIDPVLTLKVLLATAQTLSSDRSGGNFDIFFGRTLPGFLRPELKDVSTKTYAIQKLSPLTPETKRYVITNGEWYGRMAAPHLPKEDYERWIAHFDSNSEHCVLDREDFYFTMIEMLVMGTV